MKKKSLLLAFLAVSILTFGQATLPFIEPFSYDEGTLGSQNGWSASTSTVVAGSLSYSGLYASTGGKLSFGNVSGGGTQKILFTQQEGNTVYASFLMQVTELPDCGTFSYKYNVCFGNASGTFAGCINIFPDQSDPSNKFFIGVCKKNKNGYLGTTSTINSEITWSSESYPINTTMMIVLGYDLGTPGEIVKLWINPSSSSFGISSAPSPTLYDATTVSTLSSGVNLKQFIFRSGVNTPPMLMDELKIGTSWADVTPKIVTGMKNVSQSSLKLSASVLKDQAYLIGGNDQTKIDFYSLEGQLVKTVNASGSSPFFVNDLQKGIYMAKITSGNIENVQKVVKE